ncbi:MAG: HEAT repeat domain-containing protein, partial [Armatimonadota bacterium]|nr:HEAT repeat domain-containing protein [Armatimonadota bacterium]
VYTFGEEDERFKDLDKYVKSADRTLSAEEASKLIELTIKALQSPAAMERANACMELGIVISHKASIPVLVAVASNPKEYDFVRSDAIQALANVPDKEVIPHLLKIAEQGMKEKNHSVYASAFYVLHRLLQLTHVDLKEEPPKEIRSQKLWEEARGNPEKQLAIYKALWEWQKDKPIDMRKRV